MGYKDLEKFKTENIEEGLKDCDTFNKFKQDGELQDSKDEENEYEDSAADDDPDKPITAKPWFVFNYWCIRCYFCN